MRRVLALLLAIAILLPCLAQNDPALKAVRKPAKAAIRDGQVLECTKDISLEVSMADSEAMVDLDRMGTKEREAFFARWVRVEVPKGMLLTVVRSRTYKGHTITKLHLESPVPSSKFSENFKRVKTPTPEYSDVWTADLQKYIGVAFKPVE